MDYKNGKIYVIRNNVNDKLYVGSTTQPLYKRFSWHKNKMDNPNKKYQLYEAMREIGFDKFYIELIENFPCDTKEELHAREGHFIRHYDTFKNGYNMLINGRTYKEWREENRDTLLVKKKEFYQKTKEHHNQLTKRYKLNNPDKVKAWNSQMIVCECGKELTKYKYKRHLESKQHKSFIETKTI